MEFREGHVQERAAEDSKNQVWMPCTNCEAKAAILWTHVVRKRLCFICFPQYYDRESRSGTAVLPSESSVEVDYTSDVQRDIWKPHASRVSMRALENCQLCGAPCCADAALSKDGCLPQSPRLGRHKSRIRRGHGLIIYSFRDKPHLQSGSSVLLCWSLVVPDQVGH
jgi:hypothetical protein